MNQYKILLDMLKEAEERVFIFKHYPNVVKSSEETIDIVNKKLALQNITREELVKLAK